MFCVYLFLTSPSLQLEVVRRQLQPETVLADATRQLQHGGSALQRLQQATNSIPPPRGRVGSLAHESSTKSFYSGRPQPPLINKAKSPMEVDQEEDVSPEEPESSSNAFRSAKTKLVRLLPTPLYSHSSFLTLRPMQLEDDKKKGIKRNLAPSSTGSGPAGYHPARSAINSLGKRKAGPPDSEEAKKQKKSKEEEQKQEEEKHPIFLDPRMKNVEERMAEMILNEILDHSPKVRWDDICKSLVHDARRREDSTPQQSNRLPAGLEFAKKSVEEIVIYPMLRPDIFYGIRAPPKGLLLFGPPGTGKTMIGKAIASQAGATFFNISASSLTSKWVGEGEKMVRALFTVARCFPSQIKVIFIDEIDSLLTQRSESDAECSRRIKTEFLVQMDGAGTANPDQDDRILVVGATNRPQEIDEAAKRRFVKRLYIPLPNAEARKQMVCNLLRNQNHDLSDADLRLISEKTRGYSGSDMKGLCTEAALGPIRSISDIRNVPLESVRPINLTDFVHAVSGIRASVLESDLTSYIEWNRLFGSFGDPPPLD